MLHNLRHRAPPSSRFLMSLQQPCVGQAWGEQKGTPTDLLAPSPPPLPGWPRVVCLPALRWYWATQDS